MDFYNIETKTLKDGGIEVFPNFLVTRSQDLMIRGKSFYAIWDDTKKLWSTDEYDVQNFIDKELHDYASNLSGTVLVRWMHKYSTKSWTMFKEYVAKLSDNSHLLDENLTFSNTPVTKKDYVSKRLPYPLEEGTFEAWEELISTLYDPKERAKLEWAIGAIIAGDAKSIQKFIVIYGESGGGKSTILNIIQLLFEGYYTVFEAKALTSSNNNFSTEVFKGNPLVAIQHDGDLSRIEDNTRLNSIISHEEIVINEKFKPSYPAKINCFLFMGTNKTVKITDAKSGVIRRLIDVRTSGRRIPINRYLVLTSQVKFELGAIAHHCLNVYREMGKNYYAAYRPLDMIMQTDVFFNFVEYHYHTFLDENSITLKRAYDMYKTYCEEALVEFKLPRHKFRDEFRNYWENFEERYREGNVNIRSLYSGFLKGKFTDADIEEEPPISLSLDSETSLLDELLADCPAQYAGADGIPKYKWMNVNTTLKDIDTKELHYVKLPENHIVIDFDITGDDGEKSPEKNFEEASKWPITYAEYSKSGKGIHLHYIYDGDVSRLSNVYSDDIEIKVFKGDASLRRQLSRCNDIPVAHINSGLPLKGERMIDIKRIKSERSLRKLILENLQKEHLPGTKPSIDFIKKILDDAFESGLKYDVHDLKPDVLAFAAASTNHAAYCINLVAKMKFQSEEDALIETVPYKSDTIVFYDLEVFPNLLMISWKPKGPNHQCVRLINPTPNEVEQLMKMKLVGYNNRTYDNHILYGRWMGNSIEETFELSQRIIVEKDRNALYRAAYNISYTDIFDFSSEKKSLKLWQVELGIAHKELGLPWDQPVPEELWDMVGEYCDNDVISEEVVFDHLKQDFVARQILADLSGLTVNHTTQQHTERIIFGDDKNPQSKFNYVDLSETFPGYTFESGKSMFMGEDPGEGGYVHAEPGIYKDVLFLDVASMHPSSIIAMNMFGPYTKRYEELWQARIAIKHKDYDEARKLLGGTLSKYLDDPKDAANLAYALKIHALNIVYGLTDARFPNRFRDPRNVDNIVAKRGALFMILLKHAVQDQGYKVVHIKTDSIKIPDSTPEIHKFVMEFGKKYGYTFEFEDNLEKLALVNKAVYVAKHRNGTWSAIGAEYIHPVVFKTLFSKEEITFPDMCETKSVKDSIIYLDMNEKSPDEHNYIFVGRVGSFIPVKPGAGGGKLYRLKDGKYYSVTGTKDYRWLEADTVKTLGMEDQIDHSYYDDLIDSAKNHIEKFGSFKEFVS